MTRIAQSIDVNVPVRTAYNQWTQFEEFPRFMEGVREVRQLDPAHLHWRADRHGMEIEWDSEITEQIADQHIAWRDTSGPKNAGRITFQEVQPDTTRIQMTLDCDHAEAPAETGQAAPAISQRLEQDLARFKKMIENRDAESGAWRGEIHGGRALDGGVPEPAGATGDPVHKAVGQTEAERREAAQSDTGHAEARSDTRSFDERPPEGMHAAEDRTGRPSADDAQTRAGQEHGAAQRAGGSPWLPHLLQGWEEPRVMVKKMSEEMDQLFERFIGRPMASRFGQAGSTGKWMPPIEVAQRGDELIICADLPGVRIECVQIEIDQDKLTIEGERREQRYQTQVAGYRRSERAYGHFHRMIPLPAGADADAAKATMRDGVLEITMPMPASTERRGRRIDIQPPQ